MKNSCGFSTIEVLLSFLLAILVSTSLAKLMWLQIKHFSRNFTVFNTTTQESAAFLKAPLSSSCLESKVAGLRLLNCSHDVKGKITKLNVLLE